MPHGKERLLTANNRTLTVRHDAGLAAAAPGPTEGLPPGARASARKGQLRERLADRVAEEEASGHLLPLTPAFGVSQFHPKSMPPHQERAENWGQTRSEWLESE